MSLPSRGRPVNGVSPSTSSQTVSGVPVLPVYSPPLQLEYEAQHQFPPPLSYVQYGHPQPKPEYPHYPMPPPPSLYYSRYPTSHQLPASYGRPQFYTPSLITPVDPSRHLSTEYNQGRVYTTLFDSESIRNNFSRRVMSLLLLQFVISSLASGVCLEREDLRNNVVKPNIWVVWLAIVASLTALLFSRSQTIKTNRAKFELALFVTWTVGLVVLLAWTTGLLESKLILILQILLAVEIGSLVLASCVGSGRFLTGKTMLFGGICLLISAVVLSAFYTKDASIVFFAMFGSVIALIYFLFRLHYLMGDEYKKLHPDEIMAGSLSLFL